MSFPLIFVSPLPPIMAPTSVYSTSAEIIMHEGVTAVYRSNVDLFFYVLGAQGENEVRRAARWQGRPVSSSLLSPSPHS